MKRELEASIKKLLAGAGVWVTAVDVVVGNGHGVVLIDYRLAPPVLENVEDTDNDESS